MGDNVHPAVLERVGFEISFLGPPDIFRSLDKYSPRQNDLAKTIVSSALQLENTYMKPKTIVVGSPLDPGQVNQVNSFFSQDTSVLAFVLTIKQMLNFLRTHSSFPTVFVFSSSERAYGIDGFGDLSLSLNMHSDQYGTQLLQHAYDHGKQKLEGGFNRRKHTLVIEEKFGKIAVLAPEELTLKDRLKFFSRGGMDWRKANDDKVFFENGWSIGSFMTCGNKQTWAKSALHVRVDTVEFIVEHTQRPTMQCLELISDFVISWVESLRREQPVPETASVYYSLPAVPVIGWMSDRIDLILNRSIQHHCPSLLWGWHPAADFTEFLSQKGSGSSLFIEMENFPRVRATLRFGVQHAN